MIWTSRQDYLRSRTAICIKSVHRASKITRHQIGIIHCIPPTNRRNESIRKLKCTYQYAVPHIQKNGLKPYIHWNSHITIEDTLTGCMSEDTQFPQNLPLNTLYTSPLTTVCNLPHFPEVPVHHPKPAHTRLLSPMVTRNHL